MNLDMDQAQKILMDWFEKNQQVAIDTSKKIWDLAEIQFEEFKSAELLSNWLESEGFTIERGVANMPTAFVATYSTADKPVIGIIAEYDALEGLGCEIADTHIPTGKNGHACGHNLFGTASTSAAIAIKNAMEELGVKGTLKLFGCPAEEGGSAKVFMVRDGVFDGLDAMIAWHPANATMCTMASSLAIYGVKFAFHGIAAHAGVTPHLGRSALDGAILMDVGVNYLREHMTTSCRIHSVITNGGIAPNIVPSEAEIYYYLRAPQRSEVDDLFERVKDIAKGAALMTGTTVDYKIVSASSNSISSKAISEVALKNLLKVGGPKFTPEEYEFAAKLNVDVKLQDKLENMMFMYHISDEHCKDNLYEGIGESMLEGTTAPYSGDGGDVSWQVPFASYNVACQTVGTGNHSWQQTVCAGMGIGQKGMLVAAKALSLTGVELMTSPDVLKAAKKELDDKLKDYPYTSPLPDGATPFDN